MILQYFAYLNQSREVLACRCGSREVDKEADGEGGVYVECRSCGALGHYTRDELYFMENGEDEIEYARRVVG